MPVGSTSRRSVQVLGFASIGPLTPPCRLYPLPVRQASALPTSFLQIPPRDGHPCRSANTSPCRACRGLSPPSECALPGAPNRSSLYSSELTLDSGRITATAASKRACLSILLSLL